MIVLYFLIICLALGRVQGGQQLSEESWLFVGYSNTFFGATLPYGFGNQIVKEVGAATINAALPYSTTNAILDLLLHEDFSSRPAQRAFYVIEAEAILSHYQGDQTLLTKRIEYPNKILSEIETVLAYLNTRGIETTMCVMLAAGENSEENELEMHYEEWRRLLKQASVDYKVSYVDLSLAFDKYNELVNIDDVDHSTLTHDGYMLNEKGHTVVAHELLSSIGIRSLQQAVDKGTWSLLKRRTPHDEIEKLRMKYER